MMRSSVAALRQRLGLRVLLDPQYANVPNGERVRLARLRDLRRMLPFAWGANLFNAVALFVLLWGAVPHWHALLWLAVMLGLIVRSVRRGPRAQAASTHVSLAKRLAGSARRATLSGMVWAVPPLFFAGAGQNIDIGLCLVLGGVMAVAPLTISTVPLAMCGLVLPVALGLTVMMARTGSAILAVLPLIYGAALIAGGLMIGGIALRRRLAESALAEEAEIVSLLLHEFADCGAHWLWDTDAGQHLVNVSARLARAFGANTKELDGETLTRRLLQGWPDAADRPAELDAFLTLLDARASFKDQSLPLMIRNERRWWRVSGTPRYTADGRFVGYRGVGADVTEQRRRIEDVDRLARMDGLTGIANRTSFLEQLDAALARVREDALPCALLLIDLDRFKAVNDTFGHPVGDALLRVAAERLQALTGEKGCCARLGGDEFAVLVPEAGDAAALDLLAQQIQRALTDPFEVHGQTLYVGASIGVAVPTIDSLSSDALMRDADVALYRAKRSGNGTPHRFDPACASPNLRREALEADLPLALSRTQISVGYAPIAAVTDGDLLGFTARLCWHHPRHGTITGDELLSLAASTRIIAALREYALHAACMEAYRWPEHLRVHVALGETQLRDPRLPMTIRAALAASGLSPARLVLDVPEAALADAGTGLDAALDMLAATGARLSLDDAQTGFSALRHGRFSLVRVAPNVFDEASAKDQPAVALIRALTTFVDGMGLEAIAISATTSHTRANARRLGCASFEETALVSPQCAYARANGLPDNLRAAA